MPHCKEAPCWLLVLLGALTPGCTDIGPQLDRAAGIPRSPTSLPRATLADATLVPELRIPNSPQTTTDSVVVRTTAPAPVTGSQDDAGPPLRPPSGTSPSPPPPDNPEAKLHQLSRESAQHYAAI